MTKLEIVLTNPDGLHARAAAVFVQYTNRFKCDIFLISGDQVVDAKSIMGLLALGLSCGDLMRVTFNGVDEKEAKDALKDLLESGRLPVSR